MQGACNLAIGVVGFEQTDFRIIIYSQTHEYFEKGKRDINTATLGVTGDDMMVCNKGCDWRALGDGHCNPQCNNTACFWDRLDCEHDDGSCPADCHPDWIGDGYCDEACFNAKCQWDKRDCLKLHQKPCGDGCMPSLLNDHECDAMCNVESCDFDRGDCFHDNTECYKRSDGADYRGTVRTTTGGVRCQKWSDQTPQVVLDPEPDPDPAPAPDPAQPSPSPRAPAPTLPQAHTVTHAAYPRAGLGGHNYCRNPDGEERPYCYTVDENLRWDYCDVPEVSTVPCYSPPPPPPQPPHPRHPPPPTPPPPPERAPISPAGLAILVAGSVLGVCALVVLTLHNRRSSLTLAQMQLELVRSRAQSKKLAESNDSPREMRRGEMEGGAKSSTRAKRHDDNEGAPPVALVVTSISKKNVQSDALPVGPAEAGAPYV
jgi:hypothetical protein